MTEQKEKKRSGKNVMTILGVCRQHIDLIPTVVGLAEELVGGQLIHDGLYRNRGYYIFHHIVYSF